MTVTRVTRWQGLGPLLIWKPGPDSLDTLG